MFFNSPVNKQIGVPVERRDSYGRREMLTYAIGSVEEMANYTDQIRAVVRRYLEEDSDNPPGQG